MSESRTIHFTLLSTTPGALKYQEINPETGATLRQNDDGCACGTLYLRKKEFPSHPTYLRVVVESSDTEFD